MKILEFLTIIASVNIITRSQNVSSIFEGCEKFHTEYYAELIGTKVTDKAAIGVFPLYSLLALLRDGSVGPIEEILNNQVGLPPNREETALRIQDVLKELMADEHLKISNAIFIDCDLEFSPPFIKTALVSYRTALAHTNYTELEETTKFINGVHTTRTEGNVDNVLHETDVGDNTKVILGSATYYQMYFRYTFNKRNTQKKRFHENKQHSTVVSFMELKGMQLNYTKLDQLLMSSVLELPLANPSLVVIFILPTARSLGVKHTDGIISSDPHIINRVVYDLTEQKLSISIPKFKIEYGNSKLIPKEYAGNYTFIQNNLGDFNVLLNYKTVILMDDEDGVLEPEETEDELLPRFRLNRPFIFLVYNKEHNFTLFRGIFNSPYNKIYQKGCE